MEQIYDPTGWAAEENWGAGSLCYAACTVALRGALEGVKLTQLQLAHETAVNMNYSGIFEGSRGAAAKKYCENVLALEVGKPPPDFIEDVAEEGKPYLKDVWGLVGTGNLPTKQGAYDEQQMVDTLKGGGLIIINTQMHNLLVYGYEAVLIDGQESGVFDFGVWDPADASVKTWDVNDFNRSATEVVYVTK
jgi:hypothetical protein